MQTNKILTDTSMRELAEHGTPDFQFKYYYDDIQSFDNHCIDYHWHNEFEWCIIEKGTVECVIGANSILLNEGDGIFINSKAIHCFKTDNGAIMPNILFSPEFISPEMSAIYSEYIKPILSSDCTYFVFRKTDKNNILSKLNQIFKLSESNTYPKMDIHIDVCILWKDFVHITNGYWSTQQNKQSILLQARTRTMMSFIAQNHKNKITLSDIAASANISKSEALRCFNKEINTTPVNYLIDYRLKKAKEYLISTNDTITQIALNIGIDNVSYFVRLFTKKYDVTPKAFRMQNRAVI